MIRDAWLVARKDLRVEWTTKVTALQVIPFAIVIIVLFGFALGPDPDRLEPAAAGVFWLGVLFSAVVGVQRSFAVETEDSAVDGLRLSGCDPGGIFLGKLGALVVQLVGLEVVSACITALVFHVTLACYGLLIGSMLLATFGIVAVGVVYGALLISSHVRETLLPLLFFPVIAPVLISATKAWQAAFSRTPAQGTGWLELLGAFAVVYLAIGVVAFGPLLEDG